METIIVIAIVFAAACYTGWSLYKKMNPKGPGCNCSSNCNSCDPSDPENKK